MSRILVHQFLTAPPVRHPRSQNLYSAVHLNFISKLERKLMVQLARDVIASSSAQVIAKVYDQYLDFVSLEPVLFTLNQPNS